jgi:hypothetical protein
MKKKRQNGTVLSNSELLIESGYAKKPTDLPYLSKREARKLFRNVSKKFDHDVNPSNYSPAYTANYGEVVGSNFDPVNPVDVKTILELLSQLEFKFVSSLSKENDSYVLIRCFRAILKREISNGSVIAAFVEYGYKAQINENKCIFNVSGRDVQKLYEIIQNEDKKRAPQWQSKHDKNNFAKNNKKQYSHAIQKRRPNINRQGKRPGTLSKSTTRVKNAIAQFIEDNIEGLQEEYNKLEPKDKLAFMERLFKYIIPQDRRISITDFEKMDTDSLIQIAETIMNYDEPSRSFTDN